MLSNNEPSSEEYIEYIDIDDGDDNNIEVEDTDIYLKSNKRDGKLSLNKIKLNKWIKMGKIIPTCINEGCKNIVAIRHWSAQGDPSLKTECSRCAESRRKNKKIDNITFHKKNYCENENGILGFICPMDKDRYNEFPTSIYHMDHLDGNHHNNSLNNVKTFCSICHTRKGEESGDFNAFKSTSRIHKG